MPTAIQGTIICTVDCRGDTVSDVPHAWQVRAPDSILAPQDGQAIAVPQWLQ